MRCTSFILHQIYHMIQYQTRVPFHARAPFWLLLSHVVGGILCYIVQHVHPDPLNDSGTSSHRSCRVHCCEACDISRNNVSKVIQSESQVCSFSLLMSQPMKENHQDGEYPRAKLASMSMSIMIRCIWARDPIRDGVSGSSSDASMTEDSTSDSLDSLGSWSWSLNAETAKEKEM